MDDSGEIKALAPVRAELRAAEGQIESMRQASSLDEAEDLWRGFLGTLEKIWKKLDALGGRQGEPYTGWRSSYVWERKNEPLLVYLRQARNVDTHTLQSTTKREAGKLGISSGPRGAAIKSLTITDDGRIISDHVGDLRLEFRPESLRLCPVTNRGETYDPPVEFSGRKIPHPDPITVARFGLDYYRHAVDSFEDFFFG